MKKIDKRFSGVHALKEVDFIFVKEKFMVLSERTVQESPHW